LRGCCSLRTPALPWKSRPLAAAVPSAQDRLAGPRRRPAATPTSRRALRPAFASETSCRRWRSAFFWTARRGSFCALYRQARRAHHAAAASSKAIDLSIFKDNSRFTVNCGWLRTKTTPRKYRCTF
jgi:hypothetical protein